MDPLVPLSQMIFLSSATENLPLIIVIIILLIASAFFSAVETALTCCNRVRLKVKAEDGSKSARLALKILEKYDQSLITILIGNNIVNIVASAIATVIVIGYITEDGLATLVATIIMTVLVFIFGEIIPKNIAKANADKLVQILCYPLWLIYIITYPIMQIFNFILWSFKKIFRIKETDNTLTEDEFQDIIVNSEEEGVMDEEESNIIQAAVDFNDITVKSVLTPKEKMVMLDYNKLSRSEVLKNINDIKFSRIPVYANNPNKIIGILNIRRFLKMAMNSKKFALRQSMSEVIDVTDDTSLNVMVELFKSKKSHMAIVYDQNHELVGLVTMEDVLEELVGETTNNEQLKGGLK